MRDLVTEISYACKGDAQSWQYLVELTPEEWAHQPYALGQFLQTPRDEEAWMDRFARLFAAVMETHGREVLTTYLGPRSLSRSTALDVLKRIGMPDVAFAVPLIE